MRRASRPILHLVRHGAHDDLGVRLTGRSDDVTLNAEGRRQARILGERLADGRVVRIETSPRLRCRDTAWIIGQAVGLDPITEPALDEIDFGVWTRASFRALAPLPAWHAWNDRRGSTRPPQGESMAEAQARILGHVYALSRRALGDVILVSHQDIIKAVLMHRDRLDLDRHMDLEVAPASVHSVVIDAGLMAPAPQGELVP